MMESSFIINTTHVAEHVLTTATTCFFMNDGEWTEHRMNKGRRKYTTNSDTCLLRLYQLPCRQSIAIDRGPDEQIQFRAGATIEARRAPGWEWEWPGARRLLLVFDEADVLGRPRPQSPDETYDACFRSLPTGRLG